MHKNRHDKSKNRGLLGVRAAPALHIQHPVPREHCDRVICMWRGTVYSTFSIFLRRCRSGRSGVRVPLAAFTTWRCWSSSSFAGSWRRWWAGCISRFRVIIVLVSLRSLAFAIMFHWDRGIGSLWPGEFGLGGGWCCLFLAIYGLLPLIVWKFRPFVSLQSASERFRFLVPPSGTTCLPESHLRRHSRFFGQRLKTFLFFLS